MARYQAAIHTDWSPQDVFTYLSDFSSTQEWDPGVVEAERLGEAPIDLGSEFRLLAEFMGRKTPLTYRIVEYDPPRALTFLGENGTVTSRDRITFEKAGRGTRVTYDADLRLKGALRVVDPLLRIAFTQTGDRALKGLNAVLAPPSSEALDAAA